MRQNVVLRGSGLEPSFGTPVHVLFILYLFFQTFQYAHDKTKATSFMDIALLIANVSQLRFLIDLPEYNVRVVFALTLVILSIILQIGVGSVLIHLCKEEQDFDRKCRTVSYSSNQDDKISEVKRSKTPSEHLDGFTASAEEITPVQDGIDKVSSSSVDSEVLSERKHDDLDELDGGHDVIMTLEVVGATNSVDDSDNEDRLTAVDLDDIDARHIVVKMEDVPNEQCFDKFCEDRSKKNVLVRNMIFIIMVINIILSGLEMGVPKELKVQLVSNNTHA